MERRIALLFALGAALSGCGEDAPTTTASTAETSWITPPTITAVALERTSVVLAGTASPLGRVVLVAPSGQVFAAAADDAGAFRLVAPRPNQDTLYSVEVQSGQARYPAPGRLLVAATAGGPIAFVSAGAPTRRFDPAPALDAVDSDGRALFLSGRADPGSTLVVRAGVERDVVVGADGRWSVTPVGQPGVVEVDGRAFAPQTALGEEDGLDRVAGGWRLVWTAPGGARLVTWLPETVGETSP